MYIYSAATVEQLLVYIEFFFQLSVAEIIKLHPRKCILSTTIVRWCGPFIAPTRVRYDTCRLQLLLSMEPLTTATKIQRLPCALLWAKQSIPSFTELVTPLHDFFERIHAVTDKRTKRAVSCFLLVNQGWGDAVHELSRRAGLHCLPNSWLVS